MSNLLKMNLNNDKLLKLLKILESKEKNMGKYPDLKTWFELKNKIRMVRKEIK